MLLGAEAVLSEDPEIRALRDHYLVVSYGLVWHSEANLSTRVEDFTCKKCI